MVPFTLPLSPKERELNCCTSSSMNKEIRVYPLPEKEDWSEGKRTIFKIERLYIKKEASFKIEGSLERWKGGIGRR
jgi:hypothetical protein